MMLGPRRWPLTEPNERKELENLNPQILRFKVVIVVSYFGSLFGRKMNI